MIQIIFFMTQSFFMTVFAKLTGKSELEMHGRRIVKRKRMKDKIDYKNFPTEDYHVNDEK